MGISSVVTVLTSAARYKFLALHLGVEGIGRLGVLLTALTLCVTLFSVGIGSSGIRYVAASAEDSSGATTRAALIQGSRWLALLSLGGCLLLLPFATFGDYSDLLGGLSAGLTLSLVVAIAVSVASSGPLALLNGMGRLQELAKANIFGAILGSALTVLAVFVSPQAALATAVVSVPAVILLFASWYARPFQSGHRLNRDALWQRFRPMLVFGLAFSGSMLLASLVQLVLRLLITRDLGIEATGHYQAAWTVANVYLGFVLTALAAEFYPRISAVAQDHVELNAQVNAQAGIILTIGVPAVLAMMPAAPLLISLLYSADFTEAVPLLRWQLLGDILKLMGWSLGFLMLAKEAKRVYFLSELIWNAVFLMTALPMVKWFGLKGLGAAYGCAYAAYLIATLLFARRVSGYVISRRVLLAVVLALIAGVLMEMTIMRPAMIGGNAIEAAIILSWIVFSLYHFKFNSHIIHYVRRWI